MKKPMTHEIDIRELRPNYRQWKTKCRLRKNSIVIENGSVFSLKTGGELGRITASVCGLPVIVVDPKSLKLLEGE